MARLSDSITYGNHAITGDADVGGILTVGGVALVVESSTSTATNKTLSAGEKCFVTAAGLTITLPSTPAVTTTVSIGVQDFTNTVIARNGQNIMGLAENMTIDAANTVVTLFFANASEGWRII